MRQIKQRLIVVMFLSSLLYSCNKGSVTVCPISTSTGCSVNETKTNIRIKNASNYDFCTIKMIAADGTIANYGILRAGETTCYNVYQEAYGYSYLSLRIDGEDYIFQPMDYVGETPLGIGKFCYSISINKAFKMIEIKTSKD